MTIGTHRAPVVLGLHKEVHYTHALCVIHSHEVVRRAPRILFSTTRLLSTMASNSLNYILCKLPLVPEVHESLASATQSRYA